MDENKQANREEDDRKIEELVAYIRSLGLEALARDISDERFARRLLDAQVSYNYYSLQSEIWQDRSEKALQFAVSAQASLYDKAASYNNVVVTLGYAGFFAIWNMIASELGAKENAFIGTLLGISLIIFVSWTIANSVRLASSVRKYAIIAGTEFESFSEELKAHQDAEDRVNRSVLRFQRFWPFVFVVTIGCALVPGLLLLAELLFQVAGFRLGLLDHIWELLTLQTRQ